MTAGEEDAVKEAVWANEITEELLTDSGNKCPKFVHTINEEPWRHRHPKIAIPRSVVERVIGAIKSYKLLTNISFLSKQKPYDVFKLVVIAAALCNYNLRLRGTPW